MSEKLGNWSFWIMFVGMQLTFFPMHFSGLLGMPRRIYTYDADQGYTLFNQLSSIGTAILIVGIAISLWNMIRSWKHGERGGNDPWQAGTLEWSIPSPPPDYNFAELPRVTSRYPLWDVKHPELTAEVPHSRAGDERLGVAVGGGVDGHEVGAVRVNPANSQAEIPGARMHVEEQRVPTAKELGIPMPSPSIWPLVTALGIVVMFSGNLFVHTKLPVALTLLLGGATIWIGSLYHWLTTPLEEAH
jgi:cytochrome c oxidase subunit 1